MEHPAKPPNGVRGLRVDPAHHPGWVSGSERLPALGERVITIQGPASVVRHLGRTDSGGRLLELTLADGGGAPFFASAANVLVTPDPGELDGPGDPGDASPDEAPPTAPADESPPPAPPTDPAGRSSWPGLL